jgi:hypothetical protein
MMKPRVVTPAMRPGILADDLGEHPAQYGYGLSIVDDFQGEKLVRHGGSVLIATAQMAFIPSRQLGIVLLANGSGYPLSHLADYGLTVLLGGNPERLPFLRIERALEELEGVYETFRATMQITIRKDGDYLQYESKNRHHELRLTLVPEKFDDTGGRFFVLGGGTRTPVEFIKRDNEVELLYERYKLRRLGPLLKSC